ncbi:FxSxx-COOH system tetratricopeptide repeat protein [Nonomuraea thailandensis]|uniref:FxSxx-COOH system tetratricopeptide repeat protein n=1 Tax=Nonomuraea thailandensis TaxID=1188745 RepID=UPI0020A4E998|nr:FxSxx-COOH system tetratricopeptide repeat protein [Nonomuraea thailandensis]
MQERRPQVWGEKIPPRLKNFTGREDLLDVLHQSISRVTAVLPHALHGMGGVGKTQIAVEYAHRYQYEYDLVWWVSADRPELINASLAALAPRLGLQSVRAQSIAEAAAAVIEALRTGKPYDKWLLVFDNADQPEQVARLVPGGPGRVLITSRNQEWQDAAEIVLVDVFTRRESVEFLRKRVPRQMSDAEAGRLAHELGDLPLALEQAGAMQAFTGMAVDDYLVLLEKQMAAVLDDYKPREYPRSMTAAWRLSVSQLDEQLPVAVDLLRCCAFFGPEPIPREVFRRSVTEPGERLHDVLADPILHSRAIRLIGSLALAKIDPATRTIQVHRLIQSLLRGELSGEDQEYFRHTVHLLLASAAPDDPDTEANWSGYDDLIGHITAASVGACRSPQVRAFANKAVRYLHRAGDWETARAFAERFIDGWTADSGPADPEVIAAHRHLSNVLREQGEYAEAYDNSREALDLAGRVLGADDKVTLSLANGFGADLRGRGEFRAALAQDEDTLQRCGRVFGENGLETLRVMNNLALDYGLVSQYVKARELQRRAYDELRKMTPSVPAVTLVTSWNGLARLVRLCGDYAAACDLGQDVHEYALKELGANHIWTLRAGKDRSIALRRNGDYEQALEIATEVHDRCNHVLGENQPDTLAAAMNQTNILRTIGNVDQAFRLARDIVNRYPRIYGERHPYNYSCAGNLALLHRVRGDAPAAARLNEECLKGLDSTLTRKHHYSLTVAINLASDLAALGQLERARALAEQTMDTARELFGEAHPLSLGCAANLVSILRRQDREDEAEVLAGPTFSTYDELLGAAHPDTVVAKEIRPLDFDFDPPPI